MRMIKWKNLSSAFCFHRPAGPPPVQMFPRSFECSFGRFNNIHGKFVTKRRWGGQICHMKNIIFAGLYAGTILLVATGSSADRPASSTAEKARDEKAARSDETAMQGTWKGRSMKSYLLSPAKISISAMRRRPTIGTRERSLSGKISRRDGSPRRLRNVPFPSMSARQAKRFIKLRKAP